MDKNKIDEEEVKRYAIFNNTVIVVSRNLARDLEKLTKLLNVYLPSSDGNEKARTDLRRLPEYQRAIDALNDYRTALLEEIKKAYGKKE